MKNTKRNMIANIATKLWSLVSIYIFIPFYISILGEELYGVVSFFATLQSAMNIMGLGLANTLRREFAIKKGDNEFDNIRRNKMLFCIELLYWIICVFVSVVCLCLSKTIALYWLNIGSLDVGYIANVIALMGLSIALQIVASLYSGCLFGLDYQEKANILCIVWSILKHCGSLLVIKYIKADLVYFYTWHVMVDILYIIVLRLYLKRKIKTNQKLRYSIADFIIIKDIWKYAAGVLTISLIALVNKQLDKIVISKMLSLTELGAYNLATTLGNLTTVFATSMYVSVFSSFTKEISQGEIEKVNEEFLKDNRVSNIVTACMASFVAVFSIPLIQLWTGTLSYNQLLSRTAPLVVLAIASIEFQEIPYALALAHGNTKTNCTLGVVYIPIVCICTWIFIYKWGLYGAGLIYLLLMGSQTLLYEYIIYKKYIKTNTFRLIIHDTICPLLFSIFLAKILYYIIKKFVENNSVVVFLAVVSGGCVLLLELIIWGIIKKKGGKI